MGENDLDFVGKLQKHRSLENYAEELEAEISRIRELIDQTKLSAYRLAKDIAEEAKRQNCLGLPLLIEPGMIARIRISRNLNSEDSITIVHEAIADLRSELEVSA